MRRRDLVSVLAPLGLLAARDARAARPARQLYDLDVATLRELMHAGSLNAAALAETCLARIAAIDHGGPRLNSVIEVNPQAGAIAATLDRERRAGTVRGPLHGIPVLLKDNIATADAMQTTAGSLVLIGAKPPRDAHLVTRLRDAGMVVLGKTNLSEWANIRSTRSTSGWSARGGFTRNPHALDRNPSGSSSGSAVAVAAGLCALAVGTETDGSIVSPASVNGIVGLKPTVGLVSRSGIVPISHTQDTAGPMARSVADAAALLGVLVGPDPRDPTTRRSVAGTDYIRFLDPQRLRGARLGVVRKLFGAHDGVNAVIEAALVALQKQGAVLVDPVALPNVDKFGDAELEVLLTEFKVGLSRYLAEFAPGAPVASLEALIAWNRDHRDRVMPWFGQELFEKAQATGGLESPVYVDALATCARYSRAEGIDAVLAEYRLDALVAPTGGPAWLTDVVNGDSSGASFSAPAAVAGYPHLTVPAGFVSGLPVGLSFVGPAYSEGVLIGLGYAFEQATRARRAPSFAKTTPARSRMA
ncbi:MAG: amidase [Burkholderiaceae bacterium]